MNNLPLIEREIEKEGLNHKKSFMTFYKVFFICEAIVFALSFFLRNINYVETPLNLPVYEEVGFNYNEIPSTNNDVKIIGYFQSEKYFKKYESEIKELFKPDDFEKKYLEEKYNEILNLNTVSLHIRRGNYVEKKYYHENQTLDYYNKAISILGKENHYLIFSDDISWCKENFNFLKNKTFIEGNLDYQDLYLMSMCKDNIIANSSFSWWGAWMNNKNNRVIAPSKWFGPGLRHNNTKDLYCDNWIIL